MLVAGMEEGQKRLPDDLRGGTKSLLEPLKGGEGR